MQLRAAPPALILIAAIVAGATMDAVIKHLAQSNGVLLVLLARNVVGVAFAWAIWARHGRPKLTREIWRAHIARGVVMTLSSTTFFWTLTVLPLVETITLTFIYPLIVPFVAHALLGERVRLQSMFAAVLGFGGVLLSPLGSPSAQQSPMHFYGVIAVLFSAATFAWAMVLLRQRAQSDGPEIVGLMSSLIPGAILAGPAIAFSAPPNPGDWLGFLFLGFISAAFMYLLATAYSRAEAQRLAPLHYTELLWASLYGFLLFHETPRPQIYMGAALIIAACLYNAYDERRLAPKPAETT